MKLLPLLDKFDQSDHLTAIASRLRESGAVTIQAIASGARPAVAAYLSRRVDARLVLICGHQHRAEYLAQELAPWLETPLELFPAFESLAYERVPTDTDTLARRQAIVDRLARDEPLAVVAPVRAVLQPVGLPASGSEDVELRSGSPASPEDLLISLNGRGYEAASLVEETGTYARRGGIVDVFPVGMSHPVRVEFFGDEIDSLRLFDPVNQRSLERIDSLRVMPLISVSAQRAADVAQELGDLATGLMTEDAQSLWASDIEKLSEGEIVDAQFLAPYLFGDNTMFDACREGNILVVLDDGQDIATAASDLADQSKLFQKRLVESGDLPPGLRPALLEWEAIARKFANSDVNPQASPTAAPVLLATFALGGDEAATESRVFTRPMEYAGRIREFVQALDPAPPSSVHGLPHDRGAALIITSYQSARLAELLRAEDLAPVVVDDLAQTPAPGQIVIVQGSLGEGWIARSLGIELYTDHEIFGWSRPRAAPRRKRAARDAFFTDFSAGDYVVHIEHGIGRLVGTERMTDFGVEHDYLVIEYAGTDRMFIPTDQLDRITRYVGMGDVRPQLSKLGGGEWTRAKTRAVKAAEDMADELIALYAAREAQGGHAFMPDSPWQRELEQSFPFEETPDQSQAISDVKADMELTKPMDRLVVADVGYGKTEIAVRAAFKAVFDGTQVAVLAPTTVLAAQHMETFRERVEAFPVRVELLSRFRSPREQKQILARTAAGEVDILIGTHRLLGKDVKFQNLGLLIVDEEQRFGVRHKERLKQMRAGVDVLTLTATPIPRTLHMSLTGIRDVSIIQTPPEGRLPIRTYLQPYEDQLVADAVVREMERDGQVYIVHNRVASIEALAYKLRRLIPEAKILVGHGQMPEDQLEKVMLAFAHHKADVLLCSTIIESGLDIPNVNTIVIDHAESLGLAQLYQLRGRVGRGVNQAYAYLLYPRDARITKDAMRRMEAVFEATDLGAGFKIAMADLEIRGAGNLLGAQQSGHVAAIGFDLYTNLLKDAIDRARGNRVVERAPVVVDLPFDVLIPVSYVPDERERLSLYRRLATVTDEEQLAALADELADRFGRPPQAIENLLEQVKVKFLAEAAGVTSIVLRGERLIMKGEKHILWDRLGLYKRYGMNARIDTNTLRVESFALGRDWLGAIRAILIDTAKFRSSAGSGAERDAFAEDAEHMPEGVPSG